MNNEPVPSYRSQDARLDRSRHRPTSSILEVPSIMNGSNIGVAHIHAKARHLDLLIESDLNRQIRESGLDTRGPIVRVADVVREGAGSALIRAGEWVGGERVRRAAADDQAAPHSLRPAC